MSEPTAEDKLIALLEFLKQNNMWSSLDPHYQELFKDFKKGDDNAGKTS